MKPGLRTSRRRLAWQRTCSTSCGGVGSFWF